MFNAASQFVGLQLAFELIDPAALLDQFRTHGFQLRSHFFHRLGMQWGSRHCDGCPDHSSKYRRKLLHVSSLSINYLEVIALLSAWLRLALKFIVCTTPALLTLARSVVWLLII